MARRDTSFGPVTWRNLSGGCSTYSALWTNSGRCGRPPRLTFTRTLNGKPMSRNLPTSSSSKLHETNQVATMRILFCNKYSFPFSGTEVYLFELAQMLREHSHAVALFAMDDSRASR